MGTQLSIEVSASDRQQALLASEAAIRAVEATEVRLSTWRADSELARLNAAPPISATSISEQLAAELVTAQQCAKMTGGAFDPTVAPLAAVWGLREGGPMPPPVSINPARLQVGYGRYSIGENQITKHFGVTIDEGAFGKGAGLRAALQALETYAPTHAILNLGGQFAFLQEHVVDVAHPKNRRKPALQLLLPPGSFATSGNSEKGRNSSGRRIGHILDPRTGYPARDFGSVGVWSADPLLADCLSTALFVMGPEAAISWADKRDDVGVIVLETDPDSPGLRVRLSRHLESRVLSGYSTLRVMR